MSQTNLRSADAVTYMGEEAVAFGTLAASMQRCTPIADSVECSLMQDELENDAESIHLYDKQTTVQGLKSGTFKCGYYAKALSGRLTSSTLTVPVLYNVLRCLVGGMSPASGATVGAVAASPAGTATAVDVVSAANINEGEFITGIVSGVTEIGRVRSKATNTLTMIPGFSAVLTSASAVGSCITLYPDESNTKTLSVQRGLVGYASEQYQLLGCTGGFSLRIANGQLLRFDLDLVAADWSQGALSLTTTAGTDSMGAPFLCGNQKVLLQAAATGAPTQFNIDDVTIEINGGMTHIPAHGGTQGKVGVMRTGQRLACVIKVKIRADVDWQTNWSAQSLYQFFYSATSGSGTSRQHLAFNAPRCQIVGNPVRTKLSENRVGYELTLHPQIDTSLSTALLRAPWAIGIG